MSGAVPAVPVFLSPASMSKVKTSAFSRESLWDGMAVVALGAVLAFCALQTLRVARHPEEDAAMLLRYARHLAQGQGIVWNVGEKPVDGATDFLYLLAVAAVTRAGLGVESAARAVGLVAHGL